MSPQQARPKDPKVELTVGGLIDELRARFEDADQVAAYSGCCDCGGVWITFESHDGLVSIVGSPHE